MKIELKSLNDEKNVLKLCIEIYEKLPDRHYMYKQ